jgi:hypothetical protein
MSSTISSNTQRLLAQLQEITSFDFGTLTPELRSVPNPDGSGLVERGPYYKHQVWEDGRNNTTRVPAACVDALKADLDRGQLFEDIVSQLRQEGVANARRQRAAITANAKGATADAGLAAEKKNSKRPPSASGTAKQKPVSKGSEPSAERKARRR